MAEDVAPKLFEAIEKEFGAGVENDPGIRAIRDRIREGSVQLSDVHEYAERVGSTLSNALTDTLTPEALPDGRMYYNIAMRTVEPAAREAVEMVNDTGAEILAIQDERDGIRLKPVPGEFPEDRMDGLIDKLTDAAEDYQKWLGAPIQNLCESASDRFMKANADARYKAGLRPKIRRSGGANCCDWCAGLEGEYDYPNVPKEVYQRHENCHCDVTFENGRERQNVWTKERWTADRETLETRREYGLTDAADRGIVKAPDQPAREKTPGERNIEAAIHRQLRLRNDSSVLVDEIIRNHEALIHYTPSKMKDILENAGYQVLPLSNGNLKGISFQDGGGYKVNFGGDGILQYHPENRSHHGSAYWKIQNGKERHLYELDGTEK